MHHVASNAHRNLPPVGLRVPNAVNCPAPTAVTTPPVLPFSPVRPAARPPLAEPMAAPALAWRGPQRPAALPWPASAARLADGLLGQVLDALSLGLLLVDAEGLVLLANQAAQAICHAQAPLALSGQRLAGADGPRQQLANALRGACRRQWAMLMLRQDGHCLAVGVVPMGDDPSPGSPAALLVIEPGSQPSGLALQFFSQAHGLTPAESAVLAALCRGQTPAQIAASGQVAICTVRTQIASIRAKTQADSIQHLMHTVGGLPPLATARRMATAGACSRAA